MATDIFYRNEVPVIDNQDFIYTVAIPSRGRAERICKHPLITVAAIFVHESEYSDYDEIFARESIRPGALIPHNIDGLSKIRNHMKRTMYDVGADNFHIQTDDDFIGLRFTNTLKTVDYFEAGKILDIMLSSYIMARDLKTGLFFYSHTSSPWERHSWLPFRWRAWGMAACMGHIGDELWFDENLPFKHDIDMCLQAVAHYRTVFQDMRWRGRHDERGGRAGADPGGLANVRTKDKDKQLVRYLVKKWGEDVIIPKGKNRGQGMTLRVKIPQNS